MYVSQIVLISHLHDHLDLVQFQNAVIHLTHKAIKHMDKTTGGRGGLVVNISSVAGLLAAPLLDVYTTTKHAIIGFSKATAVSMGLAAPRQVECVSSIH